MSIYAKCVRIRSTFPVFMRFYGIRASRKCRRLWTFRKFPEGAKNTVIRVFRRAGLILPVEKQAVKLLDLILILNICVGPITYLMATKRVCRSAWILGLKNVTVMRHLSGKFPEVLA